MPPKGTGAPYRNGARFWGDFRGYTDVGGKREPLIPPGEKLATMDPTIARELFDQRRQELKAKRLAGGRGRQLDMHPAHYAAKVYLPYREQLLRNRRPAGAARSLSKRDVEAIDKARHALTACLSQPALSPITSLREIETGAMTEMIRQLLATYKANGEPLSPQTVRRHLMVLSAMFERAKFDGYMPQNPLERHPDVPEQIRGSALDPEGFLTREEVRGLLNELLPSSKNPWAIEQGYVIFYSGCRLEELNGLLVQDVDFAGDTLWVREHRHRPLKSKFSRRAVPLWPKLKAVLLASLARTPRPSQGLLFPSPGARSGAPLEDQMMGRLRGSLQSAARRAGIVKSIGHHIGRHSYVSARLEMVERTPLGHDVPVPNSVIVREVGHATDDLIQTTYGHLPRARVRQTILDFGDDLPDLEARAQRGRKLMAAAVKEGKEERRRRLALQPAEV